MFESWRHIKMQLWALRRRTHLHGEDRDVVPAHLLSVQGPHRHERPGSDVDVEVFVQVACPLNGIPEDKKVT